jgi:glycerophosphoryl diester phosphodiesterase
MLQTIPEIIAHRGYSYVAPENTLGAINLAWLVGADAVEIDIYLTTDNQIVLFHDRTTARTTGVDLTVSESSFDQLRALDLGKWKGDQWAGEKIATLEEALSTIPEGKRMFVEIKCHSEIIPHFLKALDASGCKDDQVAVISFYEEVIKDIKAIRPSLEAYWLCWTNRKPTEELIEIAKSSDADGLDAMVCEAFNEEFVSKVRDAGLGVYVWTIDDDAEALRMASLGVDGITTNRPPEIMALLEGRR